MEILSTILIFLSISSLLPQILKIKKEQAASFYTFEYYIQVFTIFALWLSYGIVNHINSLIYTYIISIIGYLVILYYMNKYEKINITKFIIAILILSTFSYFIAQTILFNYIAIALSMFAQLIFMINLEKQNSYSELSSIWLIQLFSIMTILTIQGIILNDLTMIIVNSIIAFLTLIIFISKLFFKEDSLIKKIRNIIK